MELEHLNNHVLVENVVHAGENLDDIDVNVVQTGESLDNNVNIRTFLPQAGATVSFCNLSYTAPGSGLPCRRTPPKEILHQVSGLFGQGVNAIMGPTGCGKSTLLDSLAARKDPSCISGSVLVNGKPPPANFKCMTGYVVQDDIVVGTLTVRENIMFSANVRLPETMSLKEKERKVEEVIDELGLTACANSKVGTPFIRGVSGGERKRTSIGMELVINPPVLFLDEPTTGLDAGTAGSVIQLLKDVSLKGRTVIMVIHQPRFSIFKLFDGLMLLSNGKTIYHGPSCEVLDFLQLQGYQCDPYDNPPDFFLDVIHGDLAKHDKSANTLVPTTTDDRKRAEIQVQRTEELAAAYKDSDWSKSLMSTILPLHQHHNQNGVQMHEKVETIAYQTSFFTQFRHIAKRQILNSLRNPQIIILANVMQAFLAIMVGLLFLRIDRNENPFYRKQNRIGVFFFITMALVMPNMHSLDVFIMERVIVSHQNISGYYRISAYFLAKVFCDLIPVKIVPVTIFSIIVYFMTGLTADPGKFFIFLLNCVLLAITAASLCFYIGSSSGTPAIATMKCVLILISMIIFGGFFVSIESIVIWLRWIRFFSIFRYSFFCFSINEFKGLNLITYNTNYENITGDAVLNLYDIPHRTHWDLWQNIFALVIITSLFMTFTYLRLKFMRKYK